MKYSCLYGNPQGVRITKASDVVMSGPTRRRPTPLQVRCGCRCDTGAVVTICGIHLNTFAGPLIRIQWQLGLSSPELASRALGSMILWTSAACTNCTKPPTHIRRTRTGNSAKTALPAESMHSPFRNSIGGGAEGLFYHERKGKCTRDSGYCGTVFWDEMHRSVNSK